jgi:hypothetical protein
MHYLDALQWPAMVVTVLAAWFTGSAHAYRRRIGFWSFIASNVLWTAWGIYSHAYALIVLQVCLCVMNLRGAQKNKEC